MNVNITAQAPQPTAMYVQPPPQPVYQVTPVMQPVMQSTPQVIQINTNTNNKSNNVFRQLGAKPRRMTCPSCGYQIKTRTHKSASGTTHLIVCILYCVFGLCCLGLAPYFICYCNNVRHECPNCNAALGEYRC